MTHADPDGHGRNVVQGASSMAYRPRALSVSAVQLYARCPAQYRRRYVERLVEPSSPEMLFGTAFHKALQAEHEGRNAERALVAAWNEAEAALAAGGRAMLCGKAHALALLDAYRNLGLGGQHGIPERKFTLPFPDPHIPVPLTGYIDLLLPERRRFREFKTTSSKAWTDIKVQGEHQLHVYAWAYQRLFRHRVETAEYVIFGTVQPTVNVIEAVPSADGFRLFEQAAALTWRGVVNGYYQPCGTCRELCNPPAEREPSGPTIDFGEALT
jgi:GNAT superfamily N-acetyltransferase